MEEIEEVIGFCLEVGLPVCLADLGVEYIVDRLDAVAEKACIPEESVHFMPFKVTAKDVAAAIVAADKLGESMKMGGCCC